MFFKKTHWDVITKDLAQTYKKLKVNLNSQLLEQFAKQIEDAEDYLNEIPKSKSKSKVINKYEEYLRLLSDDLGEGLSSCEEPKPQTKHSQSS